MSNLILHNGGAYPGNPDDVVEVVHRDLFHYKIRAGLCLWDHQNTAEDIIAYRVVKAAPVKTTVRKGFFVDSMGMPLSTTKDSKFCTHYADITLIDGKLPDEQTITLRRIE